MQRTMSSRPAGLRLILLAGLVVTACSLPHRAQAQTSPECEDIGKKLEAYGQLMQRVGSFQKKKPTADEACVAFTNLQAASKAVIPVLEQNGAWCHVPDQALVNIKAQQDQIAKVRGNACSVAAQMKKQQQQQQQGPGLLGGGDVLGGPMRVPQGAL